MIVEDTGSGLPSDLKDQIFEPFFTTKSRGRGTGLGLSIVHGIVVAHGGAIHLDSELDRGTRVTITLPTTAPGTPGHDTKSADAAKRGHGELVLVAEDNEQILDLMALGLEEAGYEVRTAGDGEAALDKLKSFNERVSLVILDVDMPKVDGLTCLRTIRERQADLPAILVSGTPQVEIGTDEQTSFLEKPMTMQALLQEVARLLEPSHRTRRA